MTRSRPMKNRPRARGTTALALACSLFTIGIAAGPTQAAEGELGDKGHFVLSVDRLFGFAHSSVTVSAGGTSTSASADLISLFGSLGAGGAYSTPRLAGDGFIAPNVSIGGALVIGHLSASSTSATTFVLAPRAGYLVHLGASASLWLRGGFTLAQLSRSLGVAGASTTETLYALTLEAPFAIRLAPRFVALVGPTLDLGLGGSTSSGGVSADVRATELGIQAGLAMSF